MRNVLAAIGGAVTRPRAESPVPLASAFQRRFSGLFDRTESVGQMESMGQLPTLWGILDTRATSLSSATWRLWRKPNRPRQGQGEAEDRIEVTDHPALTVWRNPTEFHDQTEFVKLWSMYRDLVGETYILPARMGQTGPMAELWVPRPDRMIPITHPTRFLVGWEYRTPDGQDVLLKPNQVSQFRLPNPLDPYRGLGPVQALVIDIEAAKQAAVWNLNFFRNSAMPGGIIEIEKSLSDVQFTKWQERWAEQHEGVDNAFRVGLIEGGGRWTDRGFSMRDMQFVELRRVSDEQMRQAFGMSKTMMGLTEDVNRATAEAAQYVYGRQRDIPRLNELKRWLNSTFLPSFESSTRALEWDYDRGEILPEDAESTAIDRDSRVDAATNLIAIGADPQQTLRAFGLPALDIEPPAAPAAPPALEPAEPAALPAARQSALPSIFGYPVLVRDKVGPVAELSLGDFSIYRPRVQDDLDPEDLPDTSELQDSFEVALAALLLLWADLEDDQKEDLIRQVTVLAEADDLASLPDLEVDVGPTSEALTAAMILVAAQAGEAVTSEAATQGVEVDPVAPQDDDLAEAALVIAGLIGARLVSAAIGSAMRANGPDATPATIVARVRTDLADLSPDGPKGRLSGALTGSQNDARVLTLAAGPVSNIYSSEIADSNICSECERINGTFLGTSDDMTEVLAAYPGGAFGGFVDCLGRERCRGTIVAIWDT